VTVSAGTVDANVMLSTLQGCSINVSILVLNFCYFLFTIYAGNMSLKILDC